MPQCKRQTRYLCSPLGSSLLFWLAREIGTLLIFHSKIALGKGLFALEITTNQTGALGTKSNFATCCRYT